MSKAILIGITVLVLIGGAGQPPDVSASTAVCDARVRAATEAVLYKAMKDAEKRALHDETAAPSHAVR